MSPDQDSLLSIKNLTVKYQQGGAAVTAVNEASLEICPDQTMGLVGESGSGKTTLALAVLRYLPKEGIISNGEVLFNGRNLTELSKNEMRSLWGRRMALVPQNAQASLNPSLSIADQVGELLQRKMGLSGGKALQRTRELFHQVQLGDADRVMSAYPHQLSGGMLQRVLTAMAISTEPDLLILDEPTSSLDVTTQAAILDLYRELIDQNPDTAVLYITHNLGVVAQICDHVAVMYAGEMVELGSTKEIYQRSRHPYTTALIDSVPKLGDNKSQVSLRPIQGRIPPLSERPSGCIFRPRCPLAVDVCRDYPPLYQVEGRHYSRCHRWEEIEAGEINPRQPRPAAANTSQKPGEQTSLLQMENIRVHYREGRTIGDLLRGSPGTIVRAVNGVDLEIPAGVVLGLVGESGSGKTTLARSLLGLAGESEGTIHFQDLLLPLDISDRSRETLSRLQIVFQNPQETLNPYRTIYQILSRPLMRFQNLSDDKVRQQVFDLLEAVHLSPQLASRLPGQISGGQKQRVAIARALATHPDLIIADEPISSLDVSVQASILNLFNELQRDQSLSLLFISHDLAVVGFLADEIAVIYLGELMERSPIESAFQPPFHPYMESLLSAVPLIDPEGEQKKIRLEGEIPSPSEEISGCPFHTRCPRFLGDICVEKQPPWRKDPQAKKWIYCHIKIEDLTAQQSRTFRFSSRTAEET